jgi:hypothetical protein
VNAFWICTWSAGEASVGPGCCQSDGDDDAHALDPNRVAAETPAPVTAAPRTNERREIATTYYSSLPLEMRVRPFQTLVNRRFTHGHGIAKVV